MFTCKDAVLSAFSCGRSTAVVLDSGYRKTHVTPVHDGFTLQKSIISHNLGGESLTDAIEKFIT